MDREAEIRAMVEESERREALLDPKWNPVTGRGSILERMELRLEDYDLPVQWVPLSMANVPLVEGLASAGSIERYVVDTLRPSDERERNELVDYTAGLLTNIRYRHDFAFWCAVLARIENKRGGDIIPFVLNAPQRKLATVYEGQRLANTPIRAIILKARQWGGSTMTQIYMAWLQLCHMTGLNSLIIAQVLDTATNIREMFRRLLAAYPTSAMGGSGRKGDVSLYVGEGSKFQSYGGSRNINVIPQRNCKVQIGSAEKPDTCRGEAHTLVHMSEVAYWKRTEGKEPRDIIRSATSGILYEPYTMIVFESTANRTGDFFHDEWKAAKAGTSQFAAVFVGWWEIGQYRLKLDDPGAFAASLLDGRFSVTAPSSRHEPGSYLWWLWERGATLEGIAWYVEERKKYDSHEDMAREYPTDDIEAFKHTAANVFSASDVARLARSCTPPAMVGELDGNDVQGQDALKGLRFRHDQYGRLSVWEEPEPDGPGEVVSDRYLCVVDVGRGISARADFSCVVVFDRMMVRTGGRPVVVAQWHGKTDIDLLAWKAAQIATWYNEALLVIESNTVESNGGVGQNMAGSSHYALELIGEVYPNLYYREQSPEDIIKRAPRKIGFHTNRKTKAMVIAALMRAVRDSAYVEKDTGLCHELEVYEQKPNGSMGAGHGEHDDRLMTRAIGIYISETHMGVPAIRPRRSKAAAAAGRNEWFGESTF